MKKLSIYIVLLALVAFSSCKKKSSPQSIVGTWMFSNIAGTAVSNTSTTNGTTYTYSYNATTKTITAQAVMTFGSFTDTTNTYITVTSEAWVFNTDGTYNISENYTQTGSTAASANSSGTWDYLSNTKTNQEFVFSNGQTSAVFNALGFGSGIYTIESVGSTMVLTIMTTSSNNSGSTNNTDITLTFTKA